MGEDQDKRGAKRFALSVDVKFLLRGNVEGEGALLDISETGLALLADTIAYEGDEIVAYPEGLGRLAGRVVRVFDGGVGVALTLSRLQRESIRERIATVLDGAPYMRLSENRSHIRIRYNIETTARVEGEPNFFACTIVDMSKSGCLLRSDLKPEIGAIVSVGALSGEVIRLDDDMFAVRFQRAVRGAGPGGGESRAA